MARVNKLTVSQEKDRCQMLILRLKIGMTMRGFGGVFGKNKNFILGRELKRIAWSDTNLAAALPSLVTHLKEALEVAESLLEYHRLPIGEAQRKQERSPYEKLSAAVMDVTSHAGRKPTAKQSQNP